MRGREIVMFSSMKTEALLPSIIDEFEKMGNSLDMLWSLVWLTGLTHTHTDKTFI